MRIAQVSRCRAQACLPPPVSVPLPQCPPPGPCQSRRRWGQGPGRHRCHCQCQCTGTAVAAWGQDYQLIKACSGPPLLEVARLGPSLVHFYNVLQVLTSRCCTAVTVALQVLVLAAAGTIAMMAPLCPLL
jgi:hypothetical protein